ncbi:hypothetical protein [Bradyrhizobium sp. CCBAU 53421]|uniref:hypothetical protein n=1 Tax=Bradyrhizobium sp. CCBAU 53421 TaxID=1325120 RepID=UPI00188D030B|nr:hypothetical protein [Bradyrhizobium sp. CCBAU 53421]QOZ32407.1 hypothetical protein XH92_12450 [Bradyrhizobium sp. CCBAU 53421]
MSALPHPTSTDLGKRLRDAYAVSAEFMADIISQTCRRFPSVGQSGKTSRVERLIQSGAWTDAAIALLDLELPQWQIRRLVYDEGEWHCALSRERELPDWLDQSVETRHADLALAILSGFVEAQRISTPENRTSVPSVRRETRSLYEPLFVDNIG